MKEYEFCLRCQRRLRSEEAKRLGYGKVCYKKAHTDSQKKRLFTPIEKHSNM